MDRLHDKARITQLMNGWLHRDLDNWEALAALFHSGATIEISWYKGLATDFIAASRKMGQSDLTARHLVGAPLIEFNDERATVETPVVLVIQHAGLRLGVTSHARFMDRVERQDGRWGIVDRRSSYDMASFNFPSGPVAVDMDQLSAHPREYAPLAYLMAAAGLSVDDPFPTRFSPAEECIRHEARLWLTA